jgi:hypothetical protein
MIHTIEKNQERKKRLDINIIQSEEIDEGSIATQKRGTQWFMSISKRRVRELGRLKPSQSKEELIKSRSIIQINKLVENVNWDLVNGDNYCGYQSLHAVAMHSEGKEYREINNNIQTQTKPYKLIVFLQKQLPKLQGQGMTKAIKRTNEAIQNLKKKTRMNKHSWCPTEMVEYLIPTIHPNSNF